MKRNKTEPPAATPAGGEFDNTTREFLETLAARNRTIAAEIEAMRERDEITISDLEQIAGRRADIADLKGIAERQLEIIRDLEAMMTSVKSGSIVG